MKKHISSGAVVYITENGMRKFLIMHRAKTNSWHLSKGTQNKGESLEETALREVKEETGFEIELWEYLGKLDSEFERGGEIIKKETHYFLGQPKNKNPDTHDIEHDKIYFLDFQAALNNLKNLSLYEKEGEILKIANEILNKK